MIQDGQHQHRAPGQRCGLEVSREALMMLGRHLRRGECPKTPTPLDPSSYVPFEFITQRGDPLAIIVCGACKKELGKAEVKECSSPPED